MNHYIELDWSDQSGSAYLTIHCGSRNLGKQIAEYYQKSAIAIREARIQGMRSKTDTLINRLKADGKTHRIEGAIASRNRLIAEEPEDDLCYVENYCLDDYLNDVQLCNLWSWWNHVTIYNTIARGMNWPNFDINSAIQPNFITSIHNYVDVENKIVRKGAISAQEGELGLIPLNMRDGLLIVKGKGNADYNFSAPHGAGRIMSRAKAKSELSMTDFQEEMSGIYSSSIGESTLDEAPMAYKNSDEIIAAIGDTVEIIDRLKPLYNFKDHSKER